MVAEAGRGRGGKGERKSASGKFCLVVLFDSVPRIVLCIHARIPSSRNMALIGGDYGTSRLPVW